MSYFKKFIIGVIALLALISVYNIAISFENKDSHYLCHGSIFYKDQKTSRPTVVYFELHEVSRWIHTIQKTSFDDVGVYIEIPNTVSNQSTILFDYFVRCSY